MEIAQPDWPADTGGVVTEETGIRVDGTIFDNPVLGRLSIGYGIGQFVMAARVFPRVARRVVQKDVVAQLKARLAGKASKCRCSTPTASFDNAVREQTHDG
jgi:hypothetical protein